jgi:REP element-mobilizing transposase RayT
VSHARRAPLAARFPVHATLTARRGLRSLRGKAEYAALRAAFAAGCDRFGFRLVHYSVQRDHLHVLVEAKDRVALSRGMQGLLVRVARALNRSWGRKGGVFADRYHDHILRTPKEVRRALVYVLANVKKHVPGPHSQPLDMRTSGPWFDGFKETFAILRLPAEPRPVAAPRTWLLGVGWRRHGLLSLFEAPAPPRQRLRMPSARQRSPAHARH